MSFLTETVAIPVWLLILIIGGLTPLILKLYKLFKTGKQEEIIKEERDNRVLLKLRTLRKSASPGKPPVDIAKEKSKEKKIEMVHVLKIMAAEGDKGVLLKAISDRLEISSHKVQEALQQLTNKKLIEEVVGVSGTKYYLTDLGKDFCRNKGITKSHKHY